MNIIHVEKTPEFLARRIGNFATDPRSFSSTMLLFSLGPHELVAAIGFRPAIAQELEQEAQDSEVMAIVWAKAKAGQDSDARCPSQANGPDHQWDRPVRRHGCLIHPWTEHIADRSDHPFAPI